MKVCKIELFVLDSENSSDEDIIEMVTLTKHVYTKVISLDSRTVEWTDDHPLNKNSTFDAAYKEVFSKPQMPTLKVGDHVVKRGNWPRVNLDDGQIGICTDINKNDFRVSYYDHMDVTGNPVANVYHPLWHLEEGNVKVLTDAELTYVNLKSMTVTAQNNAEHTAPKALSLAKEIATERLKGISASVIERNDRLIDENWTRSQNLLTSSPRKS